MQERTVTPPMIVHDLVGRALPKRSLSAYDVPIGIELLHEDPGSRVELYIIEYTEGTKASWHRHTAAHTIVVLEGRLEVNGVEIGPGDLCRYPAGTAMRHQQAAGWNCRFLMIFEGASDVTLLEGAD